MSAGFPATRYSVVLAARSADVAVRSRALDTLVACYWRPVYKYARLKWQLPVEDAKDLTQGFFAQAIESEMFARYDPARAKFRTYLRTCLDGFAANERRTAARLKRGGGVRFVSLDFEGAEGELQRARVDGETDMEDYFRREWIRSLFVRAVDTLRERLCDAGKQSHFALFERYDLDRADNRRPTYADLAAELGLTTAQVTNALATVRRMFRSIVLDALRELTGSEEEFRAEAKELLGVEST